MDSEKNYDNLFLSVLNHEGHIEGFLDAIFEFLYRRTDFFRVWKPGEDMAMGFPPGRAEELVKAAFIKYMKIKSSLEAEAPQQNHEEISVDCIAEEVEVSSVETSANYNELQDDPKVAPNDARTKENNNQQENNKEGDERVYVSDCESYNGAAFESYSWSQNLKDIDVLVKVPQTVATGRQVDVTISSGHLKVGILDGDEWQGVVDGDLTNRINVDQSVWTFMPHQHVHICLHKASEKWWDACFMDEPKIDVRGIDASQPFEDLDEESQAKIQELMYKEHLKRLGKPLPEQQKMGEILQEAWNLENSPFRGMPFDPSLVNLSNSGELSTIGSQVIPENS